MGNYFLYTNQIDEAFKPLLNQLIHIAMYVGLLGIVYILFKTVLRRLFKYFKCKMKG